MKFCIIGLGSFGTHLARQLVKEGHEIVAVDNDPAHINGLKDDNRIENLREATNAENMRNRGKQTNNTSGLKGISFHKRDKKFYAVCRVNGKLHFLGYYPTAEEAHAVYVAFATEHHGEFARVA